MVRLGIFALFLMVPPKNNLLPGLWLASSSPRRRSLLEDTGLRFNTLKVAVEEAELLDECVQTTVLENARRKALAAHKLEKVAPDDIVIAADTLVALGETPFSKPRDKGDAIRMLSTLSGTTHRVLTGLSLFSEEYGQSQTSVETRVSFHPLSPETIEAYASTREPYDKAGAYGIQGIACVFVASIEGSYPNVVGLPTDTLLRQLEALTGIPPSRWVM